MATRGRPACSAILLRSVLPVRFLRALLPRQLAQPEQDGFCPDEMVGKLATGPLQISEMENVNFC